MEYAELVAIIGPILILFVFGDAILSYFLSIAQFVAALFALLLGAKL